jgi:hypothetical protein
MLLVKGNVEHDGMPSGWAIPDGEKLVEGTRLRRNAIRMGSRIKFIRWTTSLTATWMGTHTGFARWTTSGRRARRTATWLDTLRREINGLALGSAILEGEFDGQPLGLALSVAELV